MLSENILAVIPARGGSKGIPRKNIVEVSGLPLIAYSINAAVNSQRVTRVIVSTDDDEISEVSTSYGAEVVLRPDSISDDKASSESAIIHVLDHLQETENYQPDIIVFLQATSPCRNSDDIDNAIYLMIKEDSDCCFSVLPEHFSGRWRIKEDSSVCPVNFDPANRPMRQDYGIEYIENGNLYVFKPSVIRDSGSRIGGKISLYPMSALQSLQIDSKEDLVQMENILAISKSSYSKKVVLSAPKLLVLDFDGVMTDNTVLVDQDGREAVFCNRGDGLGLDKLRKTDVKIMVLSTEKNPVVTARCKKLNIECVQGCNDKLSKLKEIAKENGIDTSEIIYVGNDVNDLECMKWVKTAIASRDANEKVLAIAKFITKQKGGEGVVRQVADWIVESD